MAKVTQKINTEGTISSFIIDAKKKKKKEIRLKVGLLSNYNHDGIMAYDLAKILNNGTPDGIIPPRPYNKLALENGKKIIENYFMKEFSLKYHEDFPMLLERLITSYKLTMLEMDEPSNALSTIKRKGFNEPLIHTGRLLRSIEGQINQGSKYGKGRSI